MADSFNKKERDKKRKKRKQDKAEKKKLRKLEGKKSAEFMYVDQDGYFSLEPPDPSKREEIKLEEINISTPKRSDEPEETEFEGYVKFFNQEKAYGFINKTGTNEDYFVHEDNVIDKIKDRDRVLFELGSGPKGLIAINVKIWKAPAKKAPPKKEEVEGENKGQEEGSAEVKKDAADVKQDAPDVKTDAADVKQDNLEAKNEEITENKE